MIHFTLIISILLLMYLVLLGLDSLQETGISWLLVVVVIKEKGSTFASENTGDPRVQVGDTPNGHANALLNGQARLSNALESISLDLELLGGGGGVHAEIDLGVDDLDAEICGGAKSSFKSGLVGSSAGSGRGGLAGKMGLVANTVNANAIGLDELDDAGSTLGLVTVVLKVVVVVEELSGSTVLVGETECNRQESLADGVIPHGLAVGSVFVEGLVDYVPAGADALVTGHHSLDVVLHDADERLVVETALGNPDGELRMPNQSVAVHLEVVLLRVCRIAVGIRKGEVVAGWLSRLPLHAVLGGEGVEVGVHNCVFLT